MPPCKNILPTLFSVDIIWWCKFSESSMGNIHHYEPLTYRGSPQFKFLISISMCIQGQIFEEVYVQLSSPLRDKIHGPLIFQTKILLILHASALLSRDNKLLHDLFVDCTVHTNLVLINPHLHHFFREWIPDL